MTIVALLIVLVPRAYDSWVWSGLKPELELLLEDASFEGSHDGDYMRSYNNAYFILDNHSGGPPSIDVRSLPIEDGNKTVASAKDALDHWRKCYLAHHGWDLW